MNANNYEVLAMSKILLNQQSVKLYEYEMPKPGLEDVVIHYNHNHSPVDGKFTSGPGGSISTNESKKKKKKSKNNVKMPETEKDHAIKNKDLAYAKQHVDELSTQEINDLINRINAESRLDELITRENSKNKKSKNTMKKIVSNPAFKLAAALAISSLSYASYEAYKGVTAPTPRLVDKSNPYRKQFVKDIATGAGRYAERRVKKNIGIK